MFYSDETVIFQFVLLCRALLTEGLKRLQRMGALHAFVSGYEPGPNALYAAVVGPDRLNNESWVKTY